MKVEKREPHYRKILRSELDRRCAANPKYSMRSFARALNIDCGNLSSILSGKRKLGIRSAGKIVAQLNLEPIQRRKFLESLVDQDEFTQSHQEGEPLELDEDIFKLIADWQHYGILQLCRVKGFQSDFKWIATQLSISETQAKFAVQRLLRLGLLTEKDGTFRRVSRTLDTKDKTKSAPAFRRLQKQVLEKAITSLENDQIDERGAYSMALVADPKRIDTAKKRINDFLHDITSYLEGGERKRVYHLHINLYPIQKRERS